MAHEDDIKDAIEHNATREPGLRHGDLPTTFIVARDRKKKMVLRGGLGFMGVGQMWSKEGAYDQTLAGFDSAPEVEYHENLDMQAFIQNVLNERIKK